MAGQPSLFPHAPPAYTGWLRVPPGQWLAATSGETWAGCWDHLLAVLARLAAPCGEATVLPAGRRP